MKQCPRCQILNQDPAVVCQRCGAGLPALVPLAPVGPADAPPPKQGPSGGRMLASFAASLVIIGMLGAPTLYLIAARAPEWACGLVAVVAWIFGLVLCGFMLAGARWYRRDTLLLTFALYIGAHVIMGVPGFCVLTTCVLPYREKGHASCPHVYSHDGERYALDADPLSGAFLKGAERDDWVRLDHARAVDGRYRLEIRDELHEKDALDLLELLVVDHDPSIDVLPTQDGRVLGLSREAPPIAAKDRGGADRLAAVLAPDDGAFVAMALDPAADPVDASTLELTFARPDDASAAALALRAHATKFAEDALTRYLSGMGSGLAGLMTAAERDCSYAFPERIHDEIKRLGLPLFVEVDAGQGYRPAAEIGPVGPAIQRTQAVPLPPLGSGAGPVRVRLRWTPRFWTIDAVRLGVAAALAPTATVKPSLAMGPSGSALDKLLTADGERVVLDEGQRLALEIPAPAGPSEGRARSLLLHVRGYYEMDLGNGYWLNPGALAAHNSGADTLPAFAARLANQRPDLVAGYVW